LGVKVCSQPKNGTEGTKGFAKFKSGGGFHAALYFGPVFHARGDVSSPKIGDWRKDGRTFLLLDVAAAVGDVDSCLVID
jgi:hypothetical protein